ncbi:MAG TPA: cytochrome c oxidase subunit 3 [Candidatus Eisenbacteria bacterium]|nr:cytochrome c oxidase subunit 3 [Candidatus Eisenbacteria bacterium]
MNTGSLTMPQRQPVERVPPVASTRIAMIALVTSELMLFAGLVGMYVVVRLSHAVWPPADQPRLPLLVTTINSLVLFASVVPMTAALRAIRRDDRPRAAAALGVTTLLGIVFLAVQGGEWTRLVHHGLTLGSSIYGAAFYVLIGCHAVHVLGAVVWLVVVTLLARRGRFRAEAYAGLEMCAIYWFFVAGLWAFLFPLVYLY